MPFTGFKLHPDLLKGVRELGFHRPTPIQEQAIPPAMEGRDVLACAQTGSGKTAAFVLPILHRLIGKPRGTTRALVLTPTRELAAQILEDMNALAVHTPVTAAAVYGGVGMGPQEHAFRSGVDVIIATPGRLLDHLRSPYAKLDVLVGFAIAFQRKVVVRTGHQIGPVPLGDVLLRGGDEIEHIEGVRGGV